MLSAIDRVRERYMASLLVAAVFGAAVQAIALESTIARPTDASIPHPTFQLPEVTEPPSPSVVRELLKRADVQTVLVGPDNTCGYVSGLIGAAYTCGDTNGYCAFVTTANVGYVACCDELSCGFRVDCMDAEQVENGDCNNGCMNDIYTAKCTDSSAPYCGTIRFSTSISDYFCHSLSYSTAMDALTTWIGENDGRSYSEVVVTLTSSNFGTQTSNDGLESSSTRSGSGASSTGDGSSSGSSRTSSGTSSSSSGTSSSGGQKSSTNIGPIVGGVVGGVAVIALIVLGIWLIIRRNRKQQGMPPAAPPMTQYPPTQQPPSGYAPPPGAGAPVFGAQPATSPSYDYQQQQQQQQPYQEMNGAVMHQYDGSKPQWGSPPQGGGGFTQQGSGVWYTSQETKPGNEVYTTTSASPGSPGSPLSHSDPRLSMAQPPSSPASTDRLSAFQPQHTGGTLQSQNQPTGPSVPSTVYEAGGDAVGMQGQHNANHHGQFHELSSH